MRIGYNSTGSREPPLLGSGRGGVNVGSHRGVWLGRVLNTERSRQRSGQLTLRDSVRPASYHGCTLMNLVPTGVADPGDGSPKDLPANLSSRLEAAGSTSTLDAPEGAALGRPNRSGGGRDGSHSGVNDAGKWQAQRQFTNMAPNATCTLMIRSHFCGNEKAIKVAIVSCAHRCTRWAHALCTPEAFDCYKCVKPLK